MIHLLGSSVLGLALGSNDGANVFGTAVASRMVRQRTAVCLAAGFIVLGAAVQGVGAVHTLGGLTDQSPRTAMVLALVAGGVVLTMSSLRLPVSSSQAAVGAIVGMGLYAAPGEVEWSRLTKVVACWVTSPIGAALIAATLYPTLGALYDRLRLTLVGRSILLRTALLAAGCYGAYSLGANSAGNVTGMFYGTGVLGGRAHADVLLAVFGGVNIAAGVLLLGGRVMRTVGGRLVQLGGFSALIALLALAITVHVYAFIGVPVSTSQAIVGAVLGIGLAKSVRTIDLRLLGRIVAAWVVTPALAGGICYAVAGLVL